MTRDKPALLPSNARNGLTVMAWTDYIVVGSDSGRIVILEYRPAKNEFHKVHEETFGKSGCRRIVPGQMLAADPKGRAVMISTPAAVGYACFARACCRTGVQGLGR